MTTQSVNDHSKIVEFITKSPALRPTTYRMSDIQWKFLVRAVLRGKNVMFTGPQGCGKTVGAFELSRVLERPLFNIPLGATQDPRSSLIGNTHFKHGEGTYVTKSYFVEAITTPNAIVLLDELTRAHPDAWNILMSVVDYKQRYLRIDEHPDTPTIKVAPGVVFMATANIGAQFTGTRTLDAAFQSRWEIVEVNPLNKDEEFSLLKEMFPDVTEADLNSIASIAHDTRTDVRGDNPRLTDIISTRQSIAMAELVYDGFTLAEAAEVAVYPFFSNAGGSDSERTYVRQLVQKYLPTYLDNTSTPFTTNNNASKLPWE